MLGNSSWRSGLRYVSQQLADLGLVATGVCAFGWWWLMPGGFPWLHTRFLANRVAPVLVLGTVVVALLAASRGRRSLATWLVCAMPVLWTTALVVATFTFPYSVRRFGPPVAMVALAWWLVAVGAIGWREFVRWPVVAGCLVAALLGAAWPRWQRAADPDTRPLNEPTLAAPPPLKRDRQPGIWLQPNVAVTTASGEVQTSCAGVTLQIDPLLDFESRSPDRCWTIFSPRRYRVSQRRQLVGMSQDEGRLRIAFRGNEQLLLEASADSDEEFSITATAHLESPVYSHLNTFCRFSIDGHRQLRLEFSPCPGVPIDVRFSEYPSGLPARLAYLDEQNMFHIVEAQSGEKGPFRELASGQLPASSPLVVTIFDGARPRFRIALDDWARQAGRALSPTAGWKLPVNAIEFRLLIDQPDSPATVWFSLAGTSVGRGWDSVGHAVGVYRNRLRVERLLPSAAEDAAP